ncbi:histidine kinase [Clostridium carboxidivorans P7]|uniref:PAS domain-containing sensor histidine kinase n=1 Tax=Clostridium carboxidivorans TaxID=217159 RepID=UPI0001D39415|nr:ATP-binding protein [Clostridium carboxidivorans]AKN33893.1 histidine kinase [Clostridium carboxidivorans P7]EFG86487.1 PAS domain S-box domain-containing protein [Clostridium carboxidivorans P7]
MNNSMSDIFSGSNLAEKLVETFPNFLCAANKDGDIIYINDKAKSILLKYQINDFKNFFDASCKYELSTETNKEVEKKDNPLYRAINNQEDTKNKVLKFKCNSEIKYVSLTCFPLIKKSKVEGAVLIFASTLDDYLYNAKIKDERKKFLELSTELKTKCDIIEILRNREKQHLMHLKDVINNISEGIMVFDTNEKLSLCNKAVFKILNLKVIQLVDESAFSEKYKAIYINDEGQTTEKTIYDYIKVKKTMRNMIFKIEDRVTFEIKYLELNISPILNKKDEIIYTIMTIKDVTESRLHQINAEEQAAFIKDVVNTVDVPIAVVDYPGISYRLMNKKYEQILGYNNYIMFDEKALDCEKGSYKYVKGNLYKILNSVGEKNKPYAINPYKIEDDKGEERFYKIKFTPYKNKNSNTRIHIYGSDITEEVNHNIELEKITKLKDEFFTIISHELRTPLTIICSSLQLAYDVYDKEITPNMDKTLSRINQNCSRLLKLINNILDISKAEAGFLSVNNTNFEAVYVSEVIINSSNSYAVSKGIELIFDTNQEEINVRLDKDKYEKILLNLLSNAIKFTPEGKKIIVTLKSEEEYFYLSVKDFGIGIPGDKINSIFDRFSQLNSSLTRRAEGTGIGLALVKKIIELMDGEIEVISEVGKGTEFIVKLKKVSEKENHIGNYAILTENINDRINVEFSDIN